MGFFKKIGSAITGGGGAKAKTSPYLGEYEGAAREGIYNRLGATKVANPAYKPGGKAPQYNYDFSKVGKPVTLDRATQGYDFSPTNDAIKGFRAGTPTYNPYQFNFEGLSDEYGNLAYNQGAKDVRREAAGNLQKTQEGIGVRRPGLLLKAADNNNRDTMRTLGDLNARIRLEQMKSGVDAKTAQQQAQAGENRNAAGFNADSAYRNLSALNDAGINKISQQANVLQNERAYDSEAMDYLMNLLSGMTGSQNTAAANATARRGQTLDFIKNLIPKQKDAAAAGGG